jgi:hypothetical protein
MFMKKYFTVLVVVLPFVFTNCIRNMDSSSADRSLIDLSAAKIFKINPSDTTGYDYSDVVESSDYLLLETTSASLIGEIDKIHFDDTLIFILDKSVAEAIFIFSKKGDFLTKIANKGAAPGEFLGIRDFTLDKHSKEICLFDLQGRKVNFYTYGGVFLRSKPIPFLFSEFEFLDKDTIAFSTATAYNEHRADVDNYFLVVGNMEGNVYRTDFAYPESDRDFTFFNRWHLKRFGDSVWFYPRYSNIIYQVNQTGSIPRYAFDFGKDGFSVEDKKSLTNKVFNELIKTKNYFPGDYVDLAHTAYFVIATPNGDYKLFYSKKEDKILGSTRFFIEDPLAPFIKIPFASVDSNTFVCVGYPNTVLNYIALMGEEKDKSQDAEALYKSLSESSNPILFFYTLRDHFRK